MYVVRLSFWSVITDGTSGCHTRTRCDGPRRTQVVVRDYRITVVSRTVIHGGSTAACGPREHASEFKIVPGQKQRRNGKGCMNVAQTCEDMPYPLVLCFFSCPLDLYNPIIRSADLVEASRRSACDSLSNYKTDTKT